MTLATIARTFSAAAALAAGLVVHTSAAAQMKPAAATDVVAGIEACKAITTPSWIHRDRLSELGWYTAEMRGERRTTRKVRGIYEARGNRAYVVLTGEQLRNKECVVQARLKDTASYTSLLQQVSQSVGMPTGQDGFAYIWDLGEFTMRVEPTGGRDAPNAKFAIRAAGEGAMSGSAIPLVGSDDILAGVRACVPAVGPDGFTGTGLSESGWSKGTARVDGEEIEAPVAFYGHAESKSLIMSGTGDASNKVCMVMGRVAEGATIDNIRSALTGMFGTPIADDDELYWRDEGRIMVLMTDYEDGAEGPFAVQVPVSYAGESE